MVLPSPLTPRLPLRGSRLAEVPFHPPCSSCPQVSLTQQWTHTLLLPSLLSRDQDSQREMLRPWPPSGTFHVGPELEPSPEAQTVAVSWPATPPESCPDTFLLLTASCRKIHLQDRKRHRREPEELYIHLSESPGRTQLQIVGIPSSHKVGLQGT